MVGGCVSRVVRIPFFFFNDTATTEIYTLSLHDALPIYGRRPQAIPRPPPSQRPAEAAADARLRPVSPRRPFRDIRNVVDRKSTRLNSSHANISYAVFCLKKKKNTYHNSYLLITRLFAVK